MKDVIKNMMVLLVLVDFVHVLAQMQEIYLMHRGEDWKDIFNNPKSFIEEVKDF